MLLLCGPHELGAACDIEDVPVQVRGMRHATVALTLRSLMLAISLTSARAMLMLDAMAPSLLDCHPRIYMDLL